MTTRNTPARIAVFSDFDGTIARADVGYLLYKHFSGGRSLSLIPEWKSGRLSNREILVREAEMVNASQQEILAFIDQFEVDPSFPGFARRLDHCHIPLVVVSEGMDIYIKRLLSRCGLSHVKVLCNIGILEHNRIRIEFPFQNRTCTSCGSCKGERIREFREIAEPGTKIVFLGDGYSDKCAAKEADILFAKKDLEHYCQAGNIPYNKFDTFHDVTDWLQKQKYLDDCNQR